MKARWAIMLGTMVVGAALVSAANPAAADAGYFKAGFNVLASFPFTPPELDESAPPGAQPPSAADQIPANIKALDGRRVVVTGFVLPVKMEKGLVTELLLIKDQQTCCYGVTPQLNEFVVVRLKQGVTPQMDVPLPFYGRLAVKEVFEEGSLSHIYTLDCDKVGKPDL